MQLVHLACSSRPTYAGAYKQGRDQDQGQTEFNERLFGLVRMFLEQSKGCTSYGSSSDYGL